MSVDVTAMIAPVHTALFAKLQTLVVNGEVVDIHQTLPRQLTFPCISYTVSFEPQAERIAEGVGQVEVWHSGSLEITVAVVQAVVTLLSRARLPTSIGTAVLLLSNAPGVARDPDTGRLHCVLLFRILIHT